MGIKAAPESPTTTTADRVWQQAVLRTVASWACWRSSCMVVSRTEVHLLSFCWAEEGEDGRKLLCMVSLTSVWSVVCLSPWWDEGAGWWEAGVSATVGEGASVWLRCALQNHYLHHWKLSRSTKLGIETMDSCFLCWVGCSGMKCATITTFTSQAQ